MTNMKDGEWKPTNMKDGEWKPENYTHCQTTIIQRKNIDTD